MNNETDDEIKTQSKYESKSPFAIRHGAIEKISFNHDDDEAHPSAAPLPCTRLELVYNATASNTKCSQQARLERRR
jgi:hypothetical protein